MSNIFMWEILRKNANFDCSKTLTLLEILKTQNRLLVKSCVFLVVIHLFPQVGFVKNKLRSHTVRRKLKPSVATGNPRV